MQAAKKGALIKPPLPTQSLSQRTRGISFLRDVSFYEGSGVLSLKNEIPYKLINFTKNIFVMTKLTIEIDKSNVALIRSLVEKLQGKVIEATPPNSAEALSYLTKIAENGNLTKSIKDPVSWQKELRKDRNLPFRD